MLPDAHDSPACLGELAVGVLVALPVPAIFSAPEALIDLSRAQVLRAAIPETAIEDEPDEILQLFPDE